MSSKYHAKPTVVDGIRFASKGEASRYSQLRLLEKGGRITDLKLQPRIPININGVKICTYVGDFFYFDRDKKQLVYEDFKGVKTAIYRLKKKLVKACHNIDIFESTR